MKLWKFDFWNFYSPDSDKYYNFTELACQLNEPEDGVAPTDSRLRPDQRLMEQGDWDAANAQKLRLEEKQRAARRQRESEAELAASKGMFKLIFCNWLTELLKPFFIMIFRSTVSSLRTDLV